MKRVAIVVGVAVLLLLAPSTSALAQGAVATLVPVGGSGVSGLVSAQEVGDGVDINVFATGLEPGTAYVSLYYDNATCDLEPYSAEDVIGGPYTGDLAGLGMTHGTADDPLADIHSVSVRRASDFALLACATLAPIAS